MTDLNQLWIKKFRGQFLDPPIHIIWAAQHHAKIWISFLKTSQLPSESDVAAKGSKNFAQNMELMMVLTRCRKQEI